MSNIKLSVIVPFRCESKDTEYFVHRLDDLFSTCSQADSQLIEFILVDSGSSLKYQEMTKKICADHGVSYFYHDTEGQSFSIGACRDFGVQHARGKAVSFLDVDLRMSLDFWSRLLVLMDAWGISKYKKSFLAIPCLYLTQEGTNEFQSIDSDEKYTDFYMRYLVGDKISIENMAHCSSVMIVDRMHYLSVGGHDPEFRGHGYEDFELYHRLLLEENIIIKPMNYYSDKKTWDTYTYDGFRSHLAMIARPALMMGLFVVHLWHPRPKSASFYKTADIVRNRSLWKEKFEQYEQSGFSPGSLPLAEKMTQNVLFFGKPRTNAANCLKDIFPFLGRIVFDSEYNYFEEGTFLEDSFEYMLKHSNISKIIFANPYGNQARTSIYNWCRKTNFPYYCYERGALPDSWFLDPKGFNSDSDSYSKTNWGTALSEEKLLSTKDFIKDCITGINTLEKQSPRIGGLALANKLQIGSKKVLFVPLQRPSDTVIKYMSGNIGSFTNFINVINHLARTLSSKGWVVVCKKHPLETETPALKNVIFAPGDANFIDLLEMSDRVALINSGVGVYAMMMEKPCYLFGDAFYNIEGVNKTVGPIDLDNRQVMDDLAHDIMGGFDVDKSTMYQFISYLIHEFYSFGKPKTITRAEKDGSQRTITTAIDFYQINIDGVKLLSYEQHDKKQIPLIAPLFERVGLDIHNRKSKLIEPVKSSALDKKNSTEIASKEESLDKKTRNAVVQSSAIKTSSMPIKNTHEVSVKNSSVFNKGAQDSQEKNSRRKRLVKKFRKDPYSFFKDSKNPLLRQLSYLYKHK